MKRCITILCLVLAGMVPAVAAVAESDGVKNYQVGEAKIWAIADSISERDLSIFPTVTEEIAGKYVPFGTTASAIMVFVIEFGGQVILVDTGLGGPASYMMTGLTQAGFAPEDITTVLLTHYHGDHIGGLVAEGEKVFPNAKILSSRKEQAYWLDYDTMLANPERRNNFELARMVFDVYSDASQLFDFNKNALPGIKALDGIGHTPGHTVFLLESQGEKLLFWADLTHAAALQFPRPEFNPVYDMDPEKAQAARMRFMEMAATENLPIAGAHLPFPGIGRVTKTGENSYAYTSVNP